MSACEGRLLNFMRLIGVYGRKIRVVPKPHNVKRGREEKYEGGFKRRFLFGIQQLLNYEE